MRLNLGRLITSAVLVASLAGCAPRSGKTHFDRWADQTAKRHQEEAVEAKEKEFLRAQVAPGSVGTQTAPAGTSRSSGAGRSTSSSASSSSGSAVKSSGAAGGTHTSTGAATKSRVIRPDQTNKSEEDEAIY